MIFELADLRTSPDRAAGWESPVRRGDEGAIAHAERIPGGRIEPGPRSSEWSRVPLLRRPVTGTRA
jgi:hypothetical protein